MRIYCNGTGEWLESNSKRKYARLGSVSPFLSPFLLFVPSQACILALKYSHYEIVGSCSPAPPSLSSSAVTWTTWAEWKFSGGGWCWFVTLLGCLTDWLIVWECVLWNIHYRTSVSRTYAIKVQWQEEFFLAFLEFLSLSFLSSFWFNSFFILK